MRRLFLTSAIGLAATVLLGATYGSSAIDLAPVSKVWVGGTSSVRGWSCEAGHLGAVITASNAATTQAILRSEKAIAGVQLTIPVAALECGNGTMNGHMRKALQMEQHPAITFRLDSYDLVAGDTLRVRMRGTLSIAGTAQPVTLDAIGEAAEGGTLRVRGAHEFPMTQFGVKPPSLMFGTMKVHDKVRVGFDLILQD